MRRTTVLLVANSRISSISTINSLSLSRLSKFSHVRCFATAISEIKDKEYIFKTGTCSIPHPEKKDKGGEDAHFVSSDCKVIGVADGVGGWSGHGVDPAKYSKSLMEGGKLYCDETAKQIAQNKKNNTIKNNDDNENKENEGDNKNNKTTKQQAHNPFAIMAHGWKHALHVKGSSTCCICVLDGDSGFLIARNGKIHFKSDPQQYKFNFPYQLGSAIHGHGDDPRVCQKITQQVEVGDIVVAATDGVFDNISADTIVKLINSEPGTPIDLAQKIGVQALKEGLKEKGFTSPFSIEAKKNGLHYEGGKLDDITVVVGVVTEKN